MFDSNICILDGKTYVLFIVSFKLGSAYCPKSVFWCSYNHKRSDKLFFQVSAQGNCCFVLFVIFFLSFHACGMTNAQILPQCSQNLNRLLHVWLPFVENMTLQDSFDDSLIKGCFLALLTFCAHCTDSCPEHIHYNNVVSILFSFLFFIWYYLSIWTVPIHQSQGSL